MVIFYVFLSPFGGSCYRSRDVFFSLNKILYSYTVSVIINHFEPIEHIHMSHSLVRGNWRVEADTNPIIIAKSFHDLDILRWWIDKEPKYISSFGSLS